MPNKKAAFRLPSDPAGARTGPSAIKCPVGIFSEGACLKGWRFGHMPNKKAAFRLPSDPAGARTQDPILKRDVLYQLSY